MLSGAAVVAGVVGEPVAHSLSPYLHGAWIAAAALDAAYVPFAPSGDAGFTRLIEGLRGGVVRGLNVTAPFKRAAFALADARDGAAQAAASANLMLFEPDGRVLARSTDGHGVIAAIARRAPGARPGVALLIGAGGAAAAAAAALKAAGWAVRVANRSTAAASALAGDAAFGLDAIDRAADGATLIVNALPVDPPAFAWPAGTAALDMRYRPHWTPFLRHAADAGADIVHGIDMLIAQAEPSFAAFFGREPPEVAGLREGAVAFADWTASGQR